MALSSSCNVANVGTKILEKPHNFQSYNRTDQHLSTKTACWTEQHNDYSTICYSFISFLAQGLKWWMQYREEHSSFPHSTPKSTWETSCVPENGHLWSDIKHSVHAVVLMNFNYIKWIYVKVEKEEKHWVSSPSCFHTATEICTWSGETAGHLYSSLH